ncbi:MAG: L,D-transpeptidase [Alphaproteobacteria bacterium]|nr:L,D-transpeptidase [Alphaproteobacteria bacterium]
MRRLLTVLIVFGAIIASSPAFSAVDVSVDISSQSMRVYVNGSLRHVWKVSTGRRPYYTPTGTYRPKRLERSWYSRKYNGSPMPHSIFFRGGYAIHGTNYYRALGRPASHGCIRLSRRNAAQLFWLVTQHGPSRTRIRIAH